MKTLPNTYFDGYAMLEVLISILIIAFGLLGLAGLQGFSISNNHNAYLRNQATLYAYDIADRIRANRTGFDAGNYNNGTAADTATCHPSGTPSGCTAAQMAGYDLFSWNQTLALLPGPGSGYVCVDSNPDDATACDNIGIQYVATVSWKEVNTTTKFNVVFQP